MTDVEDEDQAPSAVDLVDDAPDAHPYTQQSAMAAERYGSRGCGILGELAERVADAVANLPIQSFVLSTGTPG